MTVVKESEPQLDRRSVPTGRRTRVWISMLWLLCACGDRNETKQAAPLKTPEERIAEVRQLIQAKDATAALTAIDRLFPGDTSPVVAEERARAHEIVLAACATAACRYLAGTKANAASGTPARAAQVESQRPKLVEELEITRVSAKALLPRLQQLRELGDAGAQTLSVTTAEADLQGRAKAAVDFAAAERAKVPLLKMDVAVVEELLGPSAINARNVPMVALDGAMAFLSVDAAGKCKGIFAVGSETSKRTYQSKVWPPERLLSQALGRHVAVRPPPGGSSTSRWYEGGVLIVVRWDGGEIMELRIGDAAP